MSEEQRTKNRIRIVHELAELVKKWKADGIPTGQIGANLNAAGIHVGKRCKVTPLNAIQMLEYVYSDDEPVDFTLELLELFDDIEEQWKPRQAS